MPEDDNGAEDRRDCPTDAQLLRESEMEAYSRGMEAYRAQEGDGTAKAPEGEAYPEAWAKGWNDASANPSD